MKKENKHVLFIPRWYPSDTDSMLGLFVRRHAKAAVAAGYKITVAYASPSNEKLSNRIRISVVTEDGLTEVICYYSVNSYLRLVTQIWAWYRAVAVAIRLQGKPHLVHAHILTRTGIIALLLSWRYSIKYVITEHWSRYFNENLSYSGLFRKFLTTIVVKKASIVTVVSKRLYSAMRNQGLSFYPVILPNVIDTEIFSNNILEAELQKSVINDNPERVRKFRFISITCFEEKSKNLRALIDAANDVKISGYEFDLVMVGDGKDRRSIEQYSIEKNVPVTFTGTLTPPETATVLRESDCLVLSSNYETFGIVVYEALSSGVPVITTNVADLKELIDENCGIVIESGDHTSISEAMVKMMQNHKKYNTHYLRKKVVDISSVTAVSQQLRLIYQECMK